MSQLTANSLGRDYTLGDITAEEKGLRELVELYGERLTDADWRYQELRCKHPVRHDPGACRTLPLMHLLCYPPCHLRLSAILENQSWNHCRERGVMAADSNVMSGQIEISLLDTKQCPAGSRSWDPSKGRRTRLVGHHKYSWCQGRHRSQGTRRKTHGAE